MSSALPRFSVILPTYRRNLSGLLSKSISSVLTQSFKNFELIIVDDGSSDGSAETIRAFCENDSRIQHIRFEENIGLPAITCVSAFLKSRGDFIAWMFDDCEWDYSYLDEMSKFFNKNPSVDIAYAKCLAHFSEGSRVFGDHLNIESMLAGNNQIPNVGTIIRRSVFYDVGWYDPRIALIRINDWDFLQRCITSGFNFSHLPKTLTHEYGVALPDSLGNSYDMRFEIIKKIAHSDRRKELHPEHIKNLNPVSLPIDVNLSNEEIEDYLRLIIEFAVLGCREKIFEEVAKLIKFHNINLPLKDPSKQIQWWARVTSERWRKELSNKDLYIQEKQAHIDKQQAYIDKQQAYIDKFQINTAINDNETQNRLIKKPSLINSFFSAFFRKLGRFR
jgi:glycosyltransferase involved in cell wall biosynthesis